ESDGGTSIFKARKSVIGKRSPQEEPAESDDMADEPIADEHTRTPEESARLSPFVEALEASLTIEPLRDTRAIRVSFTHTSPAIAAGVANGVARTFMEKNFQ